MAFIIIADSLMWVVIPSINSLYMCIVLCTYYLLQYLSLHYYICIFFCMCLNSTDSSVSNQGQWERVEEGGGDGGRAGFWQVEGWRRWLPVSESFSALWSAADDWFTNTRTDVTINARHRWQTTGGWDEGGGWNWGDVWRKVVVGVAGRRRGGDRLADDK